jgi:hypothetical protein
MRTNNANGVTLQRVKSTSLYQPEQPGNGENLFFLLWDASAPPASIPLEDTWAASGTPRSVGYFLFLNVLPAGGDVAAFEQDIRKLLPNPITSAFVWVVYTPGPNSANVKTLLKTKLNASQNPCVDGDTELVLLPGQKRIGFSDGALIFALASGGLITGFVSSYPTLAGAQAPGTLGVALPMIGGLVGCVRFGGLINFAALSADSSSARKTLVEVAIDPLHPLDIQRNFERFTGEDFILSQDGNSYSISRAS